MLNDNTQRLLDRVGARLGPVYPVPASFRGSDPVEGLRDGLEELAELLETHPTDAVFEAFPELRCLEDPDAMETWEEAWPVLCEAVAVAGRQGVLARVDAPVLDRQGRPLAGTWHFGWVFGAGLEEAASRAVEWALECQAADCGGLEDLMPASQAVRAELAAARRQEGPPPGSMAHPVVRRCGGVEGGYRCVVCDAHDDNSPMVRHKPGCEAAALLRANAAGSAQGPGNG